MSKHECKYWSVNAKHHYRSCGFCSRTQYDYGGEWKDEIKLARFVDKWTGGMGGTSNDYTPYLTINAALPFEEWSYESWDDAYQIVFHETNRFFKNRTFGWYANLNHADYRIMEEWLKENPDAAEKGWTASPH